MHHMCAMTVEKQKRVPESLELELQAVEGYFVGAENQIPVL